jgi:hypothetical protein
LTVALEFRLAASGVASTPRDTLDKSRIHLITRDFNIDRRMARLHWRRLHPGPDEGIIIDSPPHGLWSGYFAPM